MSNLHDSFALEGDRVVSVAFPADLTPGEAEELGDWFALLLRKMQRLAGTTTGPQKPRPARKPASPPAADNAAAEPDAGNGPGAARTTESAHQRRLRVAQLLAAEGPLPQAEVARRLAIPHGSMRDLLACPWFEKAGPGLRDPYRLTADGRAAAGSADTAGGAA